MTVFFLYTQTPSRRLVESGVRFVRVFPPLDPSFQPWNNHSNLKTGLEGICSFVDQASAALIADLRERGLLDDVIVMWTGERSRFACDDPEPARYRPSKTDVHSQRPSGTLDRSRRHWGEHCRGVAGMTCPFHPRLLDFGTEFAPKSRKWQIGPKAAILAGNWPLAAVVPTGNGSHLRILDQKIRFFLRSVARVSGQNFHENQSTKPRTSNVRAFY